MSKHIDRGALALSALQPVHLLTEIDLGPDAHLAKRSLVVDTQAWDVEGLGHLCIMRMKAFGGVMRMETVVFAPTKVDAPLFNCDWVSALGKETQIAELYDAQLQPWPAAYQAEFQRISDGLADVPSPESEPHWYDDIRYPCSFHKQGKGVSGQLAATIQEYLANYVALLEVLPPCDEQEKAEKVRAFAERLYAEGGAAVEMITRLFGPEVAKRVVVQHMYGVSNA